MNTDFQMHVISLLTLILMCVLRSNKREEMSDREVESTIHFADTIAKGYKN